MADATPPADKISAKQALINAFTPIEAPSNDIDASDTYSDNTGGGKDTTNHKMVKTICKHLPKATSYKIKRYFGDTIDENAVVKVFNSTDSTPTLNQQYAEVCDDEHDHDHFTLFSSWSSEVTTLIHASFNTLRLWLTGRLAQFKQEKTKSENPHEKNIVPVWFAFLSLLVVPILLVPFLYFGHRMISQIADVARGWWHGWSHKDNSQPRLKSWAWWTVTLGLGLPILLLPFLFTPNFLHTKPIEPHIKAERYPYAKAISRLLVLFAALGTGFIAVTAIMASPLGAPLGLWVWLFFLAGFLSEWQTLELSMYDLLNKLFKHKNLGLKHELQDKLAKKLNKEWGVSKEKWLTFGQWKTLCPNLEAQAQQMLWMQRAAFVFSTIIAIGVFALAYSHTATALPILFGLSAFSITPIGLTTLLTLIATGTALAYFCLVYRGLRESIYNPYGDHLIGAWVKTLHKLYRNSSAKNKHWTNMVKPVATTFFALGMTFLVVFYLMTSRSCMV